MNRNKEHKDFLLPQAVYKQAYWTARDYNRMREKLKEFKLNSYLPASPDKGFAAVSPGGMSISDRTGDGAVRLCLLEERIAAVDDALASLPDKYRPGIREKVIEGGEFDYFTASINTWKKWQQIFVFNLAENLNLV